MHEDLQREGLKKGHAIGNATGRYAERKIADAQHQGWVVFDSGRVQGFAIEIPSARRDQCFERHRRADIGMQSGLREASRELEGLRKQGAIDQREVLVRQLVEGGIPADHGRAADTESRRQKEGVRPSADEVVNRREQDLDVLGRYPTLQGKLIIGFWSRRYGGAPLLGLAGTGLSIVVPWITHNGLLALEPQPSLIRCCSRGLALHVKEQGKVIKTLTQDALLYGSAIASRSRAGGSLPPEIVAGQQIRCVPSALKRANATLALDLEGATQQTSNPSQRLKARFRMGLRINDTAPDFEAETTQGKIRFHDWLGDS